MILQLRQAVGDRIVITEHLLLGVSAVRVSAIQQRAIVSAVAVFAKSTIAERWWIWWGFCAIYMLEYWLCPFSLGCYDQRWCVGYSLVQAILSSWYGVRMYGMVTRIYGVMSWLTCVNKYTAVTSMFFLTAGDWVLVFARTKGFYIQFTGLLKSLFLFVLFKSDFEIKTKNPIQSKFSAEFHSGPHTHTQ